jgi:hypothetical protein
MKPFQPVILWAAVLFSPSATAQTEKLLQGKWYFDAIRREGEDEPVSRLAMELAVGKNSFKQFLTDQRYIAYDNNTYGFGTWKFTPTGKLALLNTRGDIQEYTISRISTDSMTLYISEKYVSFVKRNDSTAQEIPALPKPPATVKATVKQIAKKWVLTSISGGNESTRPMANVMKGSWYDLRSDGTYTKKITSVREGRWQLQDNGTAISVVDDNGIGKLYYIVLISRTRLELQVHGSELRQVFETQ